MPAPKAHEKAHMGGCPPQAAFNQLLNHAEHRLQLQHEVIYFIEEQAVQQPAHLCLESSQVITFLGQLPLC